MRTILTTLTFLITQILSAQIYAKVDEIASFPACENISDNRQKYDCNQSQLKILGESNSEIVQVLLVIDGTGSINKWTTISSDDVEVKMQVDYILGELKSVMRMIPARIGGEVVNSEMILMVPVKN